MEGDAIPRDEENRAMKIYLGGEGAKGYEPSNREQRLRKEYGPEWRSVRNALDEYLKPLISRSDDWNREDLHQAAARMDAIIQECFPWFDETARGLMVDCFIYEWK